MNEHQFLIMWDMYGLEYCEDLTAIGQQVAWARLKDEIAQVYVPNLMHLRLRAQYNPQRCYEIYVITAEPGITKDDIIGMFEANPQYSAETIREIGHCFLSDRTTRTPVIT